MSEEKIREAEIASSSESSNLHEDEKSYSQDEVQNLLKALKSEREARKTLERQTKDYESQLNRFAKINPEEYERLQAEASAAAEAKAAADERTALLEEKYGSQAAEAAKRAEAAQSQLNELKKRYVLEKYFFAVGGRTDAADGISFFDMLANQVGGNFRLEADGSLTVVDSGGDPILDKESGKRINPEDYLSQFKGHPVYGTFFKGNKGSGAGIGYGGTDANGVSVEDLNNLSREELFLKAFA